MKKQRLLFRVAVFVTLVGIAGSANAADPAAGPTGRSGSGIDSGTGATDSRDPALGTAPPERIAPGGSVRDTAEPAPVAEVGMDVVTTDGQKVGEVTQIVENKVIVSIGGFLGIGDREVALNRNQLQLTDSGADAQLRTTMTEEDLQRLPEYGEPVEPATSGTLESPR